MRYGLIALEVFAILVSYLVMMMPVAFATNVNIIFNDVVQDTTAISPSSIVNKQIEIVHDPADVGWRDVKVLVAVSSASLARAIEKIYLYKCKKLNPVECVRAEPMEFETYIDTELSWADISESAGVPAYPQVANLFILLKLGGEGQTTWTGFWDRIERTQHNVFDTHPYGLSNLDLYAKTPDLVQPIKSFIENYQMIPFTWLTKAVFQTANTLYAVGASSTDIDQSPPSFITAQPAVNYVTSIAKDYYFVLPNITSGVASPIPLNLNPSFTCGNNDCEVDLGETQTSCCYDCGCQDGYYCDLANTSDPSTGACKSEVITLSIISPPSPSISDCSSGQTFSADIKVRVNSPPSSLPDSLTGTVFLNTSQYPVTCTRESPGVYNCPLEIPPEVECGSGSYTIGPNSLTLSLTYNDGPNTVTKDLTTSVSDITVNYDCACQEGYYCDAGTKSCESRGSISLGIINMTSFIEDYTGGTDYIEVNAKINNPPSDLGVTGTTYVLGNITYDNTVISGASGSATCTETGDFWTCSVPFSISNYTEEKRYVIRDNSLTFSVQFSDGADTVAMDLPADLSDITIPPTLCGDGICNPTKEDMDICCRDCGCPLYEDYCDIEKGCKKIDDISLNITTPSPSVPLELYDCDTQQEVTIQAKINNVPSDAVVENANFISGAVVQAWSVQCTAPNKITGTTDCTLLIPPQTGCKMPYYSILQNELNITISFTGAEGSPWTAPITRELSATFPDIRIIPVWHCGDGICETDYNEDSSVCCLDCPCTGTDEYCDVEPDTNPNGTCKSKSNITLVIDRPVAPVSFDSCEVPNYINISAHIENQPTGAMLQSWSATLDGEAVEHMVCGPYDPYAIPGVEINTYECRIAIPSKWDCTQGATYTYGPEGNNLTFYISFTDGTQQGYASVSTTYPQATIHQGIRTIYDIMQDGRKQMEDKLNKIVDMMEDALKKMEICFWVMFAVAVIGALLTITVAFSMMGSVYEKNPATAPTDQEIADNHWVYNDDTGQWSRPWPGSGYKWNSEQNAWVNDKGEEWSQTKAGQGNQWSPGHNWNWKKIDGKEMGSLLTATSSTSQAMTQSFQSLCDMLQQMYQMRIEMYKAQVDMIRMHMCIELNQHMLDTGQCAGQEMSCFSNIVDCLNFDEIDNFMDSMNSINNRISQDLANMAQAWSKAGKAWGDVGHGGAGGGLVVSCNGLPVNNGKCCEYCGKLKSGECADTGVTVNYAVQDCDGTPMIMMMEAGLTTPTVGTASWARSFPADTVAPQTGEKKYTFSIWCDEDNSMTYTAGDDRLTDFIEVTFVADTGNDCNCDTEAGFECVSTAPGGTSGTGKCYLQKGKDATVIAEGGAELKTQAGVSWTPSPCKVTPGTVICVMPKGTNVTLDEGPCKNAGNETEAWWQVTVKETTNTKCENKTGWVYQGKVEDLGCYFNNSACMANQILALAVTGAWFGCDAENAVIHLLDDDDIYDPGMLCGLGSSKCCESIRAEDEYTCDYSVGSFITGGMGSRSLQTLINGCKDANTQATRAGVYCFTYGATTGPIRGATKYVLVDALNSPKKIPDPPGKCPGLSQIHIGQNVKATGACHEYSDYKKLYCEPGKHKEEVGDFPENAQALVVGGPIEAPEPYLGSDNTIWWLLWYDDEYGWYPDYDAFHEKCCLEKA